MITEAILSALFGISEVILGLLPEIEWSVNTSAWAYVGDIMSMIAYLLPMGHITAIIALLISISLLRLGIAFVKLLKGFIPGLG